MKYLYIPIVIILLFILMPIFLVLLIVAAPIFGTSMEFRKQTLWEDEL